MPSDRVNHSFTLCFNDPTAITTIVFVECWTEIMWFLMHDYAHTEWGDGMGIKVVLAMQLLSCGYAQVEARFA